MGKYFRKCLGLIFRLYRYGFSPFLGNVCRFYPSCSVYAEEAIERFGFWFGLWLALKRISKCHPWHSGGVDEVPMLNEQTVIRCHYPDNCHCEA